MDREKGIEAYQALITAEAYKAKLERGDTDGLAHEYRIDGDAPVIRVEVTKAERMTPDITKYEVRTLDREDLPAWTAGAHIDVVVAPEFLRQFSLSGDPADRSRYQIAVLHERHGRGGSALMHRIFSRGRKVFISHPINHFPLDEAARRSFLMAGGIGVTPMVAMAHRLHGIGGDFTLHYSCSSRKNAGFLEDLSTFPWKDRVQLHVSDEGTRAQFEKILGNWREGDHVYTCGPDAYMQAVTTAAERGGFPEEARHLEYFSVPETPDYVNHPFTLKLAKSRLRDPRPRRPDRHRRPPGSRHPHRRQMLRRPLRRLPLCATGRRGRASGLRVVSQSTRDVADSLSVTGCKGGCGG